MTAPVQTCELCGRQEVVRPDGRGFPPDIAKRRLTKRCKEAGCKSRPRYTAGLAFGGPIQGHEQPGDAMTAPTPTLTDELAEALYDLGRPDGKEDWWHRYTDALAPLIASMVADAERRVRERVEAVLPPICHTTRNDGLLTCQDITDPRWSRDMWCLPCKVRGALAEDTP